MAENSKIEWTDATWNPITGCSVVSPGCTNCYAMGLAGTRLRNHPSRAGLTRDTKAGPVWTGEVRLNEQWLDQPLRWKRPRRIFVCAHGDLFHESVPDEWIDRVFAVMALAPQHTFQVLTKRAARMRGYLSSRDNPDGVAARIADATWTLAPKRHQLPDIAPPWLIEVPIGPRLADGAPEFGFRRMFNLSAWPLPNVWLGISVERQQEADQRIPDLLDTPAAVRFLSCEPLLGPINLTRLPDPKASNTPYYALTSKLGETFNGHRIDWVIAGGESGPHARPSHPDWFRSLRDQCQAAGVPYFFKQWGEWAPCEPTDIESALSLNSGWLPLRGGAFPRVIAELYPDAGAAFITRMGKKAAGALLDGREWREMPTPEARDGQ